MSQGFESLADKRVDATAEINKPLSETEREARIFPPSLQRKELRELSFLVIPAPPLPELSILPVTPSLSLQGVRHWQTFPLPVPFLPGT